MTQTAVDMPNEHSEGTLPFGREPRVGVLVVAYNASSTLTDTLNRIPVSFRDRISEVFVCDDASADETYLVGLDYQQQCNDLPVTVVRHTVNLGYGGNQKVGYRLAAEHDLDIIVLLHADGQYAPELIADIIAPLERGECDAVFGSRMLEKGAARKGGMPLYKFVGNRILTVIENRALGSGLSEFHSGYRAYNVHTLSELDLSATSDGFNFDTQIIIKLHSAGKKILEIPIPTFYGDEICYVNGMAYAADVLRDVTEFRLAQKGFTPGDLGEVSSELGLREAEGSSHQVIAAQLKDKEPLKILEIGCSTGVLANRLRRQGHHVTGVDTIEVPEAVARLDKFIAADLEHGLPPAVGRGYDIAIAADVLEHVRHSDRLLREIGATIVGGGKVIISVPNFGHWYPRLRTLFGTFDYDQRGILDKTHVRFYTRRSLLRMVGKNGLKVTRVESTGLPSMLVAESHPLIGRLVARVDALLVRLRPSLFAYQFVVTAEPIRSGESITYPKKTSLNTTIAS